MFGSVVMRWAGLVAGWALVVTLVPGAVAAPEPSGAVEADAADSFVFDDAGELVAAEAPDGVAAMLGARATGKPVEDLSQRSPVARVLAMPDGSWTAEDAAEPVRVESSVGVWDPIDTTLKVADGVVEPVSVIGDLRLAGGGATELASMRIDGYDVSWHWPSELPRPVLDGSTATYAGVVPGGDLVVTALHSGFRWDVVLAEAPRVAPEYSVRVVSDGLSLRQARDGSVEFVSKSGDVVLSGPAPQMWDEVAVVAERDPETAREIAESASVDSVEPVDPSSPAEPDEPSEDETESDEARQADESGLVEAAPVEAATAQAPGAAVSEVDLLADRVRDVEISVDSSGAGGVLSLRPDMGWLSAPERVYPVVVDPSATYYAQGDSWVTSSSPGSTHGSDPTLYAGSDNGGSSKYRSFVLFSSDRPWYGQKINSATLKLRNFKSLTCSGTGVIVRRVTGAWTPGGVTWNNQPATVATGEFPRGTAYGFTGCSPADMSWDVTDIVHAWSNGAANYGFRVAGASETAASAYREFRSGDYVTQSTRPRLYVSWNNFPYKPSIPSVYPSSAWAAPGGGGSGLWVGDGQPTFASKVSDPDGGLVQARFTVKNPSGTPVATCHGDQVASGGISECTLSSALNEGVTYTVTAQAHDGQLYSGKAAGAPAGTSKVRTFGVAAVAPDAPSVTCGVAAGSWGATAPGTPTACTVTANQSGSNGHAGRLVVTVDGVTKVDQTITPGTPTVVNVDVPGTNGGHELVATAKSRAGVAAETSYGFGYGDLAMSAPAAEVVESTTTTIPVTASGPPSQGGSGTPDAFVRWRLAGSGEDESTGWTDDTGADLDVVNTAEGVTVSGLWDTAAAITGVLDERKPALLDLQVCVDYAAGAQCTWAVGQHRVLRVPHAFGSNYPVAEVEGGQVALWTGELSVSATDGSVPAPAGEVSISRTLNTMEGPTEGIFGPGWAASLDGTDAGVSGLELIDSTVDDGTLVLVDEVGDPLIYAPPAGLESLEWRSGANLDAGRWVAVDEETELSGVVVDVAGTGSGTTVTVTDPEGTVTTFVAITAPAVDEPAEFGVESVNEPAAADTTLFIRDGNGRVVRILAAAPQGVTCPTGATAELPAGCRALGISYATASTATSGAPGDVAGQVSQLRMLIGTGAGTGADTDETVITEYAYDTEDRLVEVSDPRNNLTTTYTYDGSSTRVASMKPAGLKAWRYHYDNSSKRLLTVSRDPVTGSGDPVRQTTIVYDGPVSGSEATGVGLPDLSEAKTAAWGQTQAPAYMAAVFGPNKPTLDTDPSELDAADWKYGSLTYTTDRGVEVNTAEYGTGRWLPTSTSYDAHDNPVRELTATDIASIEAGTSPDQVGTTTIYNEEVRDGNDEVILPEGTVVVATLETARDILDRSGDMVFARPKTTTVYDQGAPNDGINPATGQAWALPTTERSQAVDAATGEVVETYSITHNDYDTAIGGDSDAGWRLGLVGTTTVDMDGSAGSTTDIVTETRYDTLSRVIETRQPASDGSDAGTTLTYYYTAGAHPTLSACGNKPQWADLTCRTTFAAAAANTSGVGNPDLVTTTTTDYTDLLEASEVVETANGATRTTLTTFLADGRTDTVATTVSGISGSVAVGETTYGYDPDTGLPVTTATAAAGPNPAGVVTSTYDAWGRQVTYTPKAGETTTTSYDAYGRVSEVEDPQGTTTYSYNGTDAAGDAERRGLVTGIEVSNPGGRAVVATAAYNADGALIRQDLPGGVSQHVTYDPAGEPVALAYTGTITTLDANGDPDGTTTGSWLAWAQDNDGLGRVRREWTPTGAGYTGDLAGDAATGYAREYTYDNATRLVAVDDRATPAGEGGLDPDTTIGVCQRREYTFDVNGNRTSLAAKTATAGDPCPTNTTGGITRTWGHDTGDRLTSAADNAAYVYDQFGRATVIPSVDTPAGWAATQQSVSQPGDVGLSYYDNDLARSMSQSGGVSVFGLDAVGRRSTTTTTPASGPVTVIENHYTDGSDNPAWTTTTTGGGTPVVERFAETFDAALALLIAGGGDVSIPIANPHGDVATTIDLPGSGDATGINGWHTWDEYGNPATPTQTGTTPTNPAGASDGLGYGWLGAHQRATTGLGLQLMGVRVYNPLTGAFTSTDPIPGGNTTTYAYPQDPINQLDLDGRWGWIKKKAKKAWKWVKKNKKNIALEAAGFVPVAGWGFKAYRYGRFAMRLRQAARTKAKSCSFTGSTLVLTADGTKKPIDQIQVGDLVLATDPETGEQKVRHVEEVFVHLDTVVDLGVGSGESITTTEDHPFWSVTDRVFERADQLAPGELVLTADGRVLEVAGIALETAREALAYNLAIAGIHTYHVGQAEILVHNACRPPVRVFARSKRSADRQAKKWKKRLEQQGYSCKVRTACRTDYSHVEWRRGSKSGTIHFGGPFRPGRRR